MDLETINPCFCDMQSHLRKFIGHIGALTDPLNLGHPETMFEKDVDGDCRSLMMKKPCFLKLVWVVALTAVVSSCTTSEKPQVERPLVDLYTDAFRKLEDKDYKDAFEAFTEVDRQYPYDAWAAKAQLMAAYAAYKQENFERAIGVTDTFIALHPYHPQVDYAYYLRALCYYNQISTVTKDPENAQFALEALSQVITLYGMDAKFKRDYVINHLAGHDMSVGRFYLYQKDYLSAFGRFQDVVRQNVLTPQTPEALYRLVECSVSLGLTDEAKRSAAVLGHNFPQSTWYQKAHGLMVARGLAQGQELQGQKLTGKDGAGQSSAEPNDGEQKAPLPHSSSSAQKSPTPKP